MQLQKYDRLINVTIYDKFISPYLLRRHSQYAIVALTRSGALLANQELLLAFIARRNNWISKQALTVKNKEEQLRKNLVKMQQPTTDAIREQVSREVDEQLPQKVVESALKNSSNKKQKRKRLAHAISESQKRIYAQSGADQVSSLERAFVDSGMNKLEEIPENTAIVPTWPVQETAQQETITQDAREEGERSLDRPVRVIHMISL